MCSSIFSHANARLSGFNVVPGRVNLCPVLGYVLGPFPFPCYCLLPVFPPPSNPLFLCHPPMALVLPSFLWCEHFALAAQILLVIRVCLLAECCSLFFPPPPTHLYSPTGFPPVACLLPSIPLLVPCFSLRLPAYVASPMCELFFRLCGI